MSQQQCIRLQQLILINNFASWKPNTQEIFQGNDKCLKSISYLSGDWYPGRLTQVKATFQDKDGPIGLQLGRAGQTYGRLLQGNQLYRMPVVGPGATGPPSSSTRRSSDWPAAGPRWSLARPIAQSNRPHQGPLVDPGAIGTPHHSWRS